MAEKVKLNKNTLREQKQMLSLYQEFLPTLELRKQQLQSELMKLDKLVAKKEQAVQEFYASAAPWSGMLEQAMEWVTPLVVVEQVETSVGNVAGVKVPIFEQVHYADVKYSLVATPPLYDAAIAYIHETIAAREELRVLSQQKDMLKKELVKTTQRINLYEKVMIPETQENIRKIKVYLGDQQTAAVCRAKIAKGKLVAKAAAAAAEMGGA